MTQLIVGADRDQQYVRLDRSGESHEQRHQAPVLERNDHKSVSDFLKQSQCNWSDIDQFVLLAVSHSKTTVRVNASLLATVAWYYNKPMTIVHVESLDDPFSVTNKVEQSIFDASVLGQLA